MLTDEELAQRLQAGHAEALRELYLRLAPRVLAFLLRKTGERAIAEDLLQKTFAALYRESKPIRCVRAWLYQVALNLARNQLRTRTREAHAIAKQHQDETAATSTPAQSDEAQHTRLTRALAALSPELRSVYDLRASGASYETIAERCAIPLGTVNSRMHALIQILRREISHDE